MKAKILAGILIIFLVGLVATTIAQSRCEVSEHVIVCYINDQKVDSINNVVNFVYKEDIESANILSDELSLMDESFVNSFSRYIEEKGTDKVKEQIQSYIDLVKGGASADVNLDDKTIKEVLSGKLNFEDFVKNI